MKLLAGLLFALTALAQDLPEIRGTAHEYGTNAAVAGAEIALYEFVAPGGNVTRQRVTTVFTNPAGAFSFKPLHPGDYWVEARKPSYLTGDELEALGWISGHDLVESALGITADGLPRDIAFTLIRSGGLTGRIVDENDKPVANFTVIAMATQSSPPRRDRVVTDKDGVFTFPKLVPDPRVIRIGTANEFLLPVRFPFTKEDITRVEQDIETTYWPGGVSDPALALPIKIIPGSVANVGTIRLRKVPYYRAHLTYSGECAPKETWLFTQAGTSELGMTPCAQEMVLDKLRPGSHTLAISSGSSPNTANKWALLQFSIDRENVESSVVFAPVMDIPGHFINASGNKLPDLGTTRIGLRPLLDTPYAAAGQAVPADRQGDFTIAKVPWPRHQVYFPTLSSGVVIKEVRYANQPVPDGKITIVPGATLEIVVDDQPASISGTAPPRALIYLARWPFVSQQEAPFNYMTRADDAGQFQIQSLASGDYRAVAILSGTPVDLPALGLLLSTTSKITIERGAQKTIQLK